MQASFNQFQRNYRGLNQGWNLAETDPLFTVGNPLANTQKQTWEIVVNQDVNDNTKALLRRKILKQT